MLFDQRESFRTLNHRLQPHYMNLLLFERPEFDPKNKKGAPKKASGDLEKRRSSLCKNFRDRPNQCSLMGGGQKNATPSPRLGSKERSRHVHKNPTEKPHNLPLLTEILSKQTRPQNSLQSGSSPRWRGGAPGWDRTSDHRFRRPVLYPLSYGRVGKS